MNQGASKNGGLLFELKTPSGRATHAGLLEFTAPEGTVALPKKVIRSLWGPEVGIMILAFSHMGFHLHVSHKYTVGYTACSAHVTHMYCGCMWRGVAIRVCHHRINGY